MKTYANETKADILVREITAQIGPVYARSLIKWARGNGMQAQLDRDWRALWTEFRHTQLRRKAKR